MAKVGRKPIDNPRKVLSVRMTDEESSMLKKYAEEHGLTVTQAIVLAVKLMVKQEVAKG